jgi:hypothetical protein
MGAAIAYWRREAAGSPAANSTVASLLNLRRLRTAELASEAYHNITADFEAGLRLRVGEHVEPVGELTPAPAGDPLAAALGVVSDATKAEVLAFKMVRELRLWAWWHTKVELRDGRMFDPHSDGPPLPPNLAICEGCTLIFTPARQTRAKRCLACNKRTLAGASMFALRDGVKCAPGTAIPLRVSQVAPGGTLEAWRSRHVVRCEECRGYFVVTRSDARRCGSPKCEKRALRRAA